MSCKTILVQAATAGAIEENSVTTHADPDDVGTADVVVAVVIDEETAVVEAVVEIIVDCAEVVVVVVVCAVTMHEQALLTLLGDPAQPARYVGMELAAVIEDVV